MAGTVLIVDDDVDLGPVLAELLETHGLGASVAASCQQGLQLLSKEAPIACILDWFLPDGPPVAIAAECRARGIPIILSSAAEEAQACAAEIGAAGILPKPFDVDTFYGIIDRVLSGPSLVT
jgi:OmpR family response regulator RpaB